MRLDQNGRVNSFSTLSPRGSDTAPETIAVTRLTVNTLTNSKMQFALNGFTETDGFRVFGFEGIDANWVRSAFTIRTDLALARRYGIRLQELPLLCRALLEESHAQEANRREFTYTEDLMCAYASIATAKAEAAKLKKYPRRTPETETEPGNG
jgi:hypothetical protein